MKTSEWVQARKERLARLTAKGGPGAPPVITRTSPEFKRAMKAARHLSAHRVARVANKYTKGVDWRGMPKGETLLAILNGEHQYGPPEPDEVAYDLATSEGVNGELNLGVLQVERATQEWMGLSEEDVLRDPDPRRHQRMAKLARGLADFWSAQ